MTETSGPLLFPTGSAEVTANCPPGKRAIGGGARLLGNVTTVALVESGPQADGAGNLVGWTAAATEFKEELVGWGLEVTVFCAEF